MKRVLLFLSVAALGQSFSGTAAAQLSPGAARVLGQVDLRQNGLNSVEGAEMFQPIAHSTKLALLPVMSEGVFPER